MENKLLEAARRLNLRSPTANSNPGNSAESGAWESAAKVYGQDALPPVAEAHHEKALTGQAQERAKRAKAEAEEAEARARKNEVEDSLRKGKRLSPEEHGKVVSGLVQKLIEGGVEPERAYTLTLQALSPNPGIPPSQPSGLEAHIVKTFFDDLHDEVQELRKEARDGAKRLPVTADGGKGNPIKEGLDILTRYKELGEGYMRSIGIDPEDLGRMRSNPAGANLLTNIGGNVDVHLKILEFENEQRRRWATWEKDQKRLDREQRQRERQEDSGRRTRETLSDGVSKIFDAGTRALDAVSHRAERERVEEQVERTGENPKCPDCGAELAVDGAPEGYAVCSGCGRGFPIEGV